MLRLQRPIAYTDELELLEWADAMVDDLVRDEPDHGKGAQGAVVLGQVISFAVRADVPSKPRLNVVLQNRGLIAESTTVTACAPTIRLVGTGTFRIRMKAMN